MGIQMTSKSAFLALCLIGGAAMASAQTAADNTKVNQQDRNPGEATADQQKMNSADRALTAKIRRSIMADKSLSTYAHNVKIISQDGIVTLKGPVHSDDEVKAILARTVEVTGNSYQVVNHLTVKQ
jgi:hyperosmotically inducible periplasmic protein